MIKNKYKAKVGRPKLADDKLKKSAVISICICFAISLVLCVGAAAEFTNRTAWEVLTFRKSSKVSASVSETVKVNRTIEVKKDVKIIRILKVSK